jgi:hypothetical protein
MGLAGGRDYCTHLAYIEEEAAGLTQFELYRLTLANVCSINKLTCKRLDLVWAEK